MAGGGSAGNYTDVITQNLVTLSIALAGLVAISIIFEVITDRLEKFLKKQEHWSATINRLYRELMILGFISFLFFLANSFNVFESFAKLDSGVTSASDMAHVFEFVHIAIFMTAIFYIVLVIFLMFLSQHEWNWWDKTEKSTLDILKQELHVLTEKRHKSALCYVNPIIIIQIYKKWNKLLYHKTRIGFIERQKLPSEFDFALYLRIGSRSLIAKIIELHYSIWLVFLVLIGANALRLKLGGSIETGDGGVLAFSLIGIVVFALSVGVYWKCRMILKSLIKNKESLDPDVVGHGTNDLLINSFYDGGHTHRGRSTTDLHNNAHNEPFTPRTKRLRHPSFFQRICSSRKPTPYEKLFWFHHPTFLLRIIQFLILFQAIYLTLYTLIFANSSWKVYGGWSLIMILPAPLLTILAFTPTVIPMYTMIRFVDNHTPRELQKITARMHTAHMQRQNKKSKESILTGIKKRIRTKTVPMTEEEMIKNKPVNKLVVAFRDEVLRMENVLNKTVIATGPETIYDPHHLPHLHESRATKSHSSIVTLAPTPLLPLEMSHSSDESK